MNKEKRRARLKSFLKIATLSKQDLLSEITVDYNAMTCDKNRRAVSLGYMSPAGIFYDLRRLHRGFVDNATEYPDRYFYPDYGHDSFANDFLNILIPSAKTFSYNDEGSLEMHTSKDAFIKSGWVIIGNSTDIGVKDSWYRAMTKEGYESNLSDEELKGVMSLILYISKCMGPNIPINLYSYDSQERGMYSLSSYDYANPGIVDVALYVNNIFKDRIRDYIEYHVFDA